MVMYPKILCFGSESLYESDEVSEDAHDAAALLASKVYYYLGEYEEALSFALGAGNAFEAESRAPGSGEYVETVVCEYLYVNLHPHTFDLAQLPCSAKAIDRYVQARTQEGEDTEEIDPKLQGIIEGIFRRCIQDGEYKQVSKEFTVCPASIELIPPGYWNRPRV